MKGMKLDGVEKVFCRDQVAIRTSLLRDSMEVMELYSHVT